jgi:hypothetical protein
MIRIGIWVWGAITVALALAVVGLVIAAGFYMNNHGGFRADTPPLLGGMFQALKASRTAIGAVVGFSGLAWAHFFQAGNPTPTDKSQRDEELRTEPTEPADLTPSADTAQNLPPTGS